jgi:capsid portal protein
MGKEKFHIEYVFDKVSNHSLWNHLTTPMGLSAWFADEVKMDRNKCTFTWNKTGEDAEIVFIKPEIAARYRWLDDEDEDAYFEFMIHDIELTGATSLEITDFAEPDEKADAIALWDSQVDELKRSLGI